MMHLLNRALWRGFVWLLFIASVEFAWQMYEMGLLWPL